MEDHCDICYEILRNKAVLECKHELCLKCFMVITSSDSLRHTHSIRCHICRRTHKFKKVVTITEEKSPLKEILEKKFPR